MTVNLNPWTWHENGFDVAVATIGDQHHVFVMHEGDDGEVHEVHDDLAAAFESARGWTRVLGQTF